MAVNVMVQIGRKVGWQIVGHAVEFLEHVEESGQLILDRLDAHDRPALPRDVLREFNRSFLDHSGDFHSATIPRQRRRARPQEAGGHPLYSAAELREPFDFTMRDHDLAVVRDGFHRTRVELAIRQKLGLNRQAFQQFRNGR